MNFSYVKSMANSKVFHWNFSLSTNPQIVRSDTHVHGFLKQESKNVLFKKNPFFNKQNNIITKYQSDFFSWLIGSSFNLSLFDPLKYTFSNKLTVFIETVNISILKISVKSNNKKIMSIFKLPNVLMETRTTIM